MTTKKNRYDYLCNLTVDQLDNLHALIIRAYVKTQNYQLLYLAKACAFTAHEKTGIWKIKN